MSGHVTPARFSAVGVIAGLARVALGVLWINEGLLKWRAHFGAADILLVVQSTRGNSRVPGFYKDFTAHVLGAAPGLFGFGVPVIETLIGILLILGLFTLPAALASSAELTNYWFADQLIVQYPIMVALSVVVAAFAVAASRYSVSGALARRRGVGAGDGLVEHR